MEEERLKQEFKMAVHQNTQSGEFLKKKENPRMEIEVNEYEKFISLQKDQGADEK